MAAANIPDASTIVRCLGLENRDPLQNMIAPDVILGNALVVETKYRAMCSLIKDSGCHVCVDLPCGYTPKALHLSKAGMRFIGLDLPIVVQEIEPIIRSLTTSSDEISFHGIDATNYESIRTALQNVTGPLCITTEGMMMYFDAHEADAVVSNIRAMLELHGGLWITPDPEFILQFFYSFRSIFGKDSLAKLATSKESAQQQANVTNLSNPLIINPDDISRSAKTAETSEAYNLALAGAGFALIPQHLTLSHKELIFLPWEESPHAPMGIYYRQQGGMDKNSAIYKFITLARECTKEAMPCHKQLTGLHSQ